jgi:hypothetical protein
MLSMSFEGNFGVGLWIYFFCDFSIPSNLRIHILPSCKPRLTLLPTSRPTRCDDPRFALFNPWSNKNGLPHNPSQHEPSYVAAVTQQQSPAQKSYTMQRSKLHVCKQTKTSTRIGKILLWLYLFETFADEHACKSYILPPAASLAYCIQRCWFCLEMANEREKRARKYLRM